MKNIIPILAVVAVIGCASFSTNVFRTEQTAVNAVYASYQGYLSGLTNGVIHVTADQSNQVRHARLTFAATVGVVETWRSAYETNSQVKPQLQAALDSAIAQSSNIVWLVQLYSTKQP